MQIEIPESPDRENQHQTSSDDVEQVICVDPAFGDFCRRRRCRNGHGFRHITTFPSGDGGPANQGYVRAFYTRFAPCTVLFHPKGGLFGILRVLPITASRSEVLIQFAIGEVR